MIRALATILAIGLVCFTAAAQPPASTKDQRGGPGSGAMTVEPLHQEPVTLVTADQPANSSLEAAVRRGAAAVEPKIIQWRRDIHEHPELGDQENRTAGVVAEHLRDLGLEVRTGVARTGVVGILTGRKPGRTVALRADMDALPVKEPPRLPFASRAKGQYLGNEVDVMHACGHDTHTAMLMGTAEVLAGLRNELPGTVMFIFQPAEEGSSLFGPSSGKAWGARLMLEEGVFEKNRPDAIFGLHVGPGPAGQIFYRGGAVTASSDTLEITITGKQGHGGMPWYAVDPITTSAQVILDLQTVVSRKTNLTASPAVVTIGVISGGTRPNIVPETVRLSGTIRTYHEKVRQQVIRDVRVTAEKIAESAGAKAEVSITSLYDVTINDEALTTRMLPVLRRAADGHVSQAPQSGASEDFSVFAKVAPGMYIGLGITPRDQDPAKAAPNHNPDFYVDESALVVGTRALGSLAVDFLATEPEQGKPSPPTRPSPADNR
ncbi:MAG: amidohydrolase [Phycisphaerae bacterium]|nr:amidohydrolase [Phycisphaerae bacterium]